MRRVTIHKFDGSVIKGKITNIEFEGTDGGYPVYTAFIKGDDGIKYMTAVSSEDDRKISDTYIQEDSEEETWIYSD